jgi:hypothetical protein
VASPTSRVAYATYCLCVIDVYPLLAIEESEAILRCKVDELEEDGILLFWSRCGGETEFIWANRR